MQFLQLVVSHLFWPNFMLRFQFDFLSLLSNCVKVLLRLHETRIQYCSLVSFEVVENIVRATGVDNCITPFLLLFGCVESLSVVKSIREVNKRLLFYLLFTYDRVVNFIFDAYPSELVLLCLLCILYYDGLLEKLL
jgi:hypothetical protein